MSLATKLFGRNRVSGQPAELEANQFSELLVSHGLPQFTEMTRRGRGYSCTTETPFTTVAALPTTTAALEIYNNSSSANPLVLVVVDLYAFQLLATAAVQSYSVWGMVTTQKAAPSVAALELYSLSGKPAIIPTAASPVIPAVGTTIVANGWRPFDNPQPFGLAAATPGASWCAPVNGKLLVPPGCALCVTVVGSLATASSFHCGATFYLEPVTMASMI